LFVFAIRVQQLLVMGGGGVHAFINFGTSSVRAIFGSISIGRTLTTTTVRRVIVVVGRHRFVLVANRC